MPDRYQLRVICDSDCEWGTFLVGEDCPEPATQVILDTAETGDYAEGFHVAHLCDEHARRGLVETIGDLVLNGPER